MKHIHIYRRVQVQISVFREPETGISGQREFPEKLGGAEMKGTETFPFCSIGNGN